MDLPSEKHNQEVFSRKEMMESLTLFSPDSSPYSRRYQEFRLNLAIEASRDRDVLDLGCGTGEYAIRTAPHAKSVTCVDNSQAMLDELIKKIQQQNIKNISVVCSSLRALPSEIKDESYDTAISYSTLYYVEDLESVFKELYKKLRPGGNAYLELGNEKSLNHKIGLLDSTGVQQFGQTPQVMKQLLEAQGFVIQNIRRFQILPMWGFWYPHAKTIRERILRRFLPSGRSSGARYLFSRKINGRMLDEIISSMPWVRDYAFRYFFHVQKAHT